MEQQYIIYGGTKYKAQEAICENCQKPFLTATRFFSRAKHHYCCRECKDEGAKKLNAAQRLIDWQSTKHICEHCGKVMAIKYGSGRFCSKSCANTHSHTEESKQKISIGMKNFISINGTALQEANGNKTALLRYGIFNARYSYSQNPKVCCVCGKQIPYSQRVNKTCSKECYRLLMSNNAKERKFGGLTNGGGLRSKHGSYKSIHCDSTFELIYLIYCLENNINIQRNTKAFSYINSCGVRKRYYPDFYMPDTDTYIEVKGYKDCNVDLKLEAVKSQGYKINILYKNTIAELLAFINKKFNTNYNIKHADIAELFDKK